MFAGGDWKIGKGGRKNFIEGEFLNGRKEDRKGIGFGVSRFED